MALSKIHLGRMAEDSSITSAKITDGTIVNADLNACAAVTASKTLVGTTSEVANANMNVALLGFKMAVTESLTVFNLVDGVVDEFHSEDGTDEAEGSNDTYCASNDNYINQVTGSPVSYSGAVGATGENTESDTFTTSIASGSPNWNSGTAGVYTVPTGTTAVNIYAFGAGGMFFHVFGGGHLGYLLSAKQGSEDVKSQTESLDFGVTAGIAVTCIISEFNMIRLDVAYELGLANQATSGEESKNRLFTLGLSYLFH